MPIRTWLAFDLLVGAPKRDRSDLRQLTVQLLDAPAGRHAAVGRKLTLERSRRLTRQLELLETRDLDEAGVIELGETLAGLLLPTGIGQLLAESLDGLGRDEGLRIKLRLDPTLAHLPWEYAWIPRQAGQRDAGGFLALDPRASIVREETVAGRIAVDPGPRERRVVALLADPTVPGRRPLNLALERLALETALTGVPGITPHVREDATIGDLSDALVDGADVLHFAGHGEADTLYLVDAQGRPWPLPAAQLALNVRARGVQLVVLGACDSGARDPAERWSGVATRLMAERIPAVVAMQYRINDGMAIAFGERFYRSLAAGWSLDEAVSAGRLAIYNRATGGRDDQRRPRLWRDWGVPVLYARPDAAVSLASVANEPERARLEKELVSSVRVRTAQVKQGGLVVGVRGGSDIVDVAVETGDVAGTVIGAEWRAGEGDGADIDVTTKDVEAGGEVIGASIEPSGPPRRRRRRDR